jgi:hypothetical protein
MNELEERTAPVLGPMLPGPALSAVLDPVQQAILATWAVKTSLLLTYRTFKLQSAGWIPADNLKWLYLTAGPTGLRQAREFGSTPLGLGTLPRPGVSLHLFRLDACLTGRRIRSPMSERSR